MAHASHLDRLRSADWLKLPATRRVFDVLATTGAVSRAVGGAVRNTLLGRAIDDIDIATAASPTEVLAAANRAGVKAIPTGLAHGTVTLVVEGTHFEVTTLRRDVETDGRHAIVAFTGDWALDAGRRDFTINALYCDADGTLFDPLNGSVDIDPTRVRFIGSADQRIDEDALRILRFFRFSAQYALRSDRDLTDPDTIAFDEAGLAACRAHVGDLARLSRERVRAEMLKILVAPAAVSALAAMIDGSLLPEVLGTAVDIAAVRRLAILESVLARQPDAVLRLAALALRSGADVGVLRQRLRLANAEADRLLALVANPWPLPQAHEPVDPRADAQRLYRLGRQTHTDALLFSAARHNAVDPSDLQQRMSYANAWQPAKRPFDGADLRALGIPPGPRLGQVLEAVEAWWIAQDFKPDRAACLAELAKRVATGD